MSITYSELPALLASGAPGVRERVIELARKQFDVAYYKARGDLVRALAHPTVSREGRDELVAILRVGLGAALSRGDQRTDGGPGLDANFIGAAAAAVALGKLEAREAIDDLRTAFAGTGHEASHFELRQAAGPIAVVLATLGASVAREVAAVLADCESIWEDRVELVAQLRYADWLLRGDAAGASAFLATERVGKEYAAAALADLKAEAGAERKVWGLGLWHPNEPVAEFPKIYAR